MLKGTQKSRRSVRTRKKLLAVGSRPRLSVYRSNKHVAVQIIDDATAKTLVGITESNDVKGTKTERARALGVALAKKAKELKITSVVFDKGPYAYHGRVKAIAEGAREGGLSF
jgi:large subunit ribosomal protein L18